MTDSSEYNALLKSRRYARAKITRICNKVNTALDELTPGLKTDYTAKLRRLRDELGVINGKIVHLKPDTSGEEMDEALVDEEEEYEDNIIRTLEMMNPPQEEEIPEQESPHVESFRSDSEHFQPNANKVKLPTITLPEFSNSPQESLSRFFYSFESILGKHHLSEYDKFVYLRGQLRGDPAQLLQNLDTNEQSYGIAKEILTEAFSSPITQRYDVIKELSKLKLKVGDNIYKYVGSLKNIVASFKFLEIDIDTVVQFFVWEGLNPIFQDQLVNITNDPTPSLQAITENIFAAARRYQKVVDVTSESKGDRRFSSPRYKESQNSNNFQGNSVATNNLAIKITTSPFKKCNICTADRMNNVNHALKECRNYPTANNKILKLDSLGFCSRCSFSNHTKDNCKFKFSSKCKNCSGYHMIFLCPNPIATAVSDITCVHFNSYAQNDNIFLPTFTADINNKECRILYDTGSQRNFIHERIASRLDAKVKVKDIEILIQGFNIQKVVKTNIVEVSLYFNNKSFDIEAIIVPTIDLKIHIENLNVIVNAFKNSNYILADSRLESSSSLISDFDLVMGPDASRLLCPRTVSIGSHPDSSVFLETNQSVLFMGDARALAENLKYLPKYGENVSKIKRADIGKNKHDKSQCSDIKIKTNVRVNFVNEILDSKGEIIQCQLQGATDQALEQCTVSCLQYDSINEPGDTEINNKIIDYVLSNTERTDEGRLIMPLPWHPGCKHLLGDNYNLSKKILFSNLTKLKKDNLLTLYNKVFQEQEELGIIERINDIDGFIASHPEVSFLPHMGVVKMSRETTKVRAVFLANLCEKTKLKPNAVSHNHALLPGPCLNSKLSTSLLLSRFDKYILIFDITKAFLGIELRECDQNKLMFLWFRNVDKGDFEIIAFRNLRLSFGLRPSPAILMLALHKMLLMDIENDDDFTIQLKKQVYSGIYMDNGMVSTNDESLLYSYYSKLPSIFDDYKFQLQQYASNNRELQLKIDADHKSETENVIKFFGMQWNRESDSFGPFPIKLNIEANSKRTILSSLNSVYDIFNLYGPILNRGKVFFQKLQLEKSLTWDATLPPEQQNEWRKICKSVNSTPQLSVDRFVGSRESSYVLTAFSDASGAVYGCVIYITEVETGRVSFVQSKNKVINSKMKKKSIPSLECQGVAYAAEVLIDLYNELNSERNNIPIKIVKLFVYSDSMVTLAWIKGFHLTYEKMQKKTIFVQNRLKQIGDLCSIFPITFRYIEGKDNPADSISRVMSYRRLINTCYFTGPEFLKCPKEQPDIEVTVPHLQPVTAEDLSVPQSLCFALKVNSDQTFSTKNPEKYLIDLVNYSSFTKVVNIYKYVIKFIYIVKSNINQRKVTHSVEASNVSDPNFNILAVNTLIRTEQNIYFADVVQFFKERVIPLKGIPNLVLQMNLYLDENFIIRVKGKFHTGRGPILMSNKSYLCKLIIDNIHIKFSHIGVYSVLKELRKDFWVLKGFSAVRKVIKDCIICRKFNELPIKLNQNSYRQFRLDPPRIPFAYVFLDHLGPINVKFDGKIKKIWLLIVTCLWTRAVSLYICFSFDTTEFLRCIQIHIYKHGLFMLCLSDLGSQIVCGTNLIANFIDDVHCYEFFKSQGIETPKFEHYAKGNSSLGSLVETCVKQTKMLLLKSIGKHVLTYPDFELLIFKTNHLINRRPISFKEGLRDTSTNDDVPDPITPEQLMYGRDLISLNVIPHIQPDFEDDDLLNPQQLPQIVRDESFKLRKSLAKLSHLYHSEFLVQLLSQAVDVKDRYKPVVHKVLSPGDLVLLVEPNTKRSNYPMGVVKHVTFNSLGETTSAMVLKADTKRIVFRHSSSLILLLKRDEDVCSNNESDNRLPLDESLPLRTKREAAVKANGKITDQLASDQV